VVAVSFEEAERKHRTKPRRRKVHLPLDGGIGVIPPAPTPEPRRPKALTPRLVNLTAEAPTEKVEDWKLVARCPRCGKEVTWMAQTCSCEQPLKWPEEISCPFCNGKGTCPVCKGGGVCKHCKGRAKRAMMGIVIEKCGYCDGTGKCSACKGTGKCPKCNGTGKIVPAAMKR